MHNDLDDCREIPFSELPSNYEKLLKRIRNLNISGVSDIPEDVGGILDLDVDYFSSFPGVGKLYVQLLTELKKELKDGNDLSWLPENRDYPKTQLDFCIIPSSLSNLHFNYQFLANSDIKLLKKLESLFGAMSVKDILDYNADELSSVRGVGKSKSETLILMQERIKLELINLTENYPNLSIKDLTFLVSSEIKFYPMSMIDECLLEDIENYLWSLDEMHQDIALSRWGFNQASETLEEVGERYQFTRERVRQIEKQINSRLPMYFRVHPNVLWENIRERIGDNLIKLLPHLSKCFDSEKPFLSFLEICCQVEKGSIIEATLPKIKKRILYSFFSVTPSPVSKEAIISELTSEFGYTRALSEITIRRLVEIGVLKYENQGILPQNLGNKEAIAHVLTSHPEGLPWKDIARIANKQGYAKYISDERLTHGFNDSEYVYLCSHGNYRHQMFLDIDKFDLDSIFQHLLDYFKLNGINALNLHDYFLQTIDERPEIEYFTLRHIVREYGDAVGIFFNGRSGVDNVSLSEKSERVTQWDVVIQSLNRSKGAMTKVEIAEKLRSKSLNHATYYLNGLMEENKIVRIDQLMYTTPEKAFKDINVLEVMGLISSLIKSTNRIIESDIFREKINVALNLSYSKYFYSALVGSNAKEYGYYRANNFISDRPLKYKNMQQVCRDVCEEDVSNDENIKRMREIVWLTNAVAESALYQWKWILKQ